MDKCHISGVKVVGEYVKFLRGGIAVVFRRAGTVVF
jgi:hypothetical protein